MKVILTYSDGVVSEVEGKNPFHVENIMRHAFIIGRDEDHQEGAIKAECPEIDLCLEVKHGNVFKTKCLMCVLCQNPVSDPKNTVCDECRRQSMEDVPFFSLEDYEKMIKGKDCRWCSKRGKKVLLPSKIKFYDHSGGWEVDGFEEKQWLYVECPKCGYEWSLQKLGVPR